VKKLFFALVIVIVVALVGTIIAFAKTEHCPDGWTSKVEAPPNLNSIVLPVGTSFCVKGSTEASGILTADGSTTLFDYLGNGHDVSHYVLYEEYVPCQETITSVDRQVGEWSDYVCNLETGIATSTRTITITVTSQDIETGAICSQSSREVVQTRTKPCGQEDFEWVHETDCNGWSAYLYRITEQGREPLGGEDGLWKDLITDESFDLIQNTRYGQFSIYLVEPQDCYECDKPDIKVRYQCKYLDMNFSPGFSPYCWVYSMDGFVPPMSRVNEVCSVCGHEFDAAILGCGWVEIDGCTGDIEYFDDDWKHEWINIWNDKLCEETYCP
jgi:hypothetical protein